MPASRRTALRAPSAPTTHGADPPAPGEGQVDAVHPLREPVEARAPAELHQRLLAHPAEQGALDRRLLQVREARRLARRRLRELDGEQLAAAVERARAAQDQSLGDALRAADAREDVERVAGEEHRLRALVLPRQLRLEHERRHTVPRQLERRDQPDRARADDRHPVGGHVTAVLRQRPDVARADLSRGHARGRARRGHGSVPGTGTRPSPRS
jgi:hypothetical protein